MPPLPHAGTAYATAGADGGGGAADSPSVRGRSERDSSKICGRAAASGMDTAWKVLSIAWRWPACTRCNDGSAYQLRPLTGGSPSAAGAPPPLPAGSRACCSGGAERGTSAAAPAAADEVAAAAVGGGGGRDAPALRPPMGMPPPVVAVLSRGKGTANPPLAAAGADTCGAEGAGMAWPATAERCCCCCGCPTLLAAAAGAAWLWEYSGICESRCAERRMGWTGCAEAVEGARDAAPSGRNEAPPAAARKCAAASC